MHETGFIKDETLWTSGWVHSRVYCYLCANPSPMTYTGTNTWVVLGPSPEFSADTPFEVTAAFVRSCAVFDPATPEEATKVFEWCQSRNLIIKAVVSTHWHHDHTDGCETLANLAGCPWLSVERGNLHEGTMVPGETRDWADGLPVVEAVSLPGHSADSFGFVIEGSMCMITGDVIFSQGPTVIKQGDGNLADYLASLYKLHLLVRDARCKIFLTGHGYPIYQCHRLINASREHRTTRLNAIREAIASGVEPTPEAIVASSVYEGIDPGLVPAALKSAALQLEYLEQERSGKSE